MHKLVEILTQLDTMRRFIITVVASLFLALVGAFLSAPAVRASSSSIFLFTGRDPINGSSVIYSINPDGTGLRAIGSGRQPHLSSDGTKIVYVLLTSTGSGCHDGDLVDIYTMNLDGSNVTNLTQGAFCYAFMPVWSPDGTKIAFYAAPISTPDNGGIFVMNADGSNPTELVGPGRHQSWSPDGTKIVYSDPSNGGIFVMNADGSNPTELVASGDFPSWSPDGTKIAYFDGGSMHTINPDGSGSTTVITDSNINLYRPAWSPDSSTLAFIGGSGIYTVSASGGGTPSLIYYNSSIAPSEMSWGNIPSANTAPVVNPLSGGGKNEGDTYSETGSFTDPDSTSWTGSVDYGDGTGFHDFASPDESIDQTNHTFTINHVYQDEGTYTVTVAVTDNQGATGTGTATVTVNNATPVVNAITVSNPIVQVSSSTTASANFTDPGVLDTHNNSGTYWNWGDGSTTTATVTESNGSGSVSDSHTYTAAGVYTITLTVTDDDGTNPGMQTYQYVSVYNPTSQGLFSAGQRFSSPAGAYPQNLSLTGTVKFGLSYKYQGTMPVGDKQFTMNFSAANLLFNATTISSLVISNSMATLTGTGTINGGSQTYNFLVTGVDGGGIRVQITDPSNNNNVIYDTQPGAPATATPTTSVTGNVIAHN